MGRMAHRGNGSSGGDTVGADGVTNGLATGPNSGSVTISSLSATSQALSVPFTITASSSSTAWPNGYSYAGTITVPHTVIKTRTRRISQCLFRGLIRRWLARRAVRLITNPNGYDIIFTSDAAGTSTGISNVRRIHL